MYLVASLGHPKAENHMKHHETTTFRRRRPFSPKGKSTSDVPTSSGRVGLVDVLLLGIGANDFIDLKPRIGHRRGEGDGNECRLRSSWVQDGFKEEVASLSCKNFGEYWAYLSSSERFQNSKLI